MLNFKDFFESQLTLRYHDELNPKIWKNKNLNPEIRKHLLKIAKAWREFANIPEGAVTDILFTGGNANYNYTKYSDIDVHLIIDKNKIAKCSVLDDYLLDKKTLWSINHDIEIVGYPVEIYAQDMKEETRSNQGVFSLTKNKWLTFPKQIEVNYDDPYLLKKINHYKHIMDQFMNSKCDDVIKMKKFKAKFKSMRQAAIDHGGEFSLENLIFKELRNRGYLDKFTDYIHNIEDHQLTYK